MSADNEYGRALQTVLIDGIDREDRTGVGTRSIFGYQMRFDLQDGFPLLTSKKVFFRGIAEELFWFISGDTNVRSLQEKKVKIWDEWADENGDLGPVYGFQWRHFGADEASRKLMNMTLQDKEAAEHFLPDVDYDPGIDQFAQVLEDLRNNPFSRRHIVNAWNPVDVPRMALPPCHTMFQFYVRDQPYYKNTNIPVRRDTPVDDSQSREIVVRRMLDCQLYQRSGDIFLGIPFNIASYALLVHLVAQHVGMAPGHFIHTVGDLHLYSNHFDQAREQLSRTPRQSPRLVLNPEKTNIFDFTYEDLSIVGYDPHPAIKAPVAV